jgi:hypothetical protein
MFRDIVIMFTRNVIMFRDIVIMFTRNVIMATRIVIMAMRNVIMFTRMVIMFRDIVIMATRIAIMFEAGSGPVRAARVMNCGERGQTFLVLKLKAAICLYWGEVEPKAPFT